MAVAVSVRPRIVRNLSLLNLVFIGDPKISPTVPHQFLTEEGAVGSSLLAGGLPLSGDISGSPLTFFLQMSPFVRYIFVLPKT